MALFDCERSSVAIEVPDEAADMCGSHVRQFDDMLRP
jgi:hypothetical protein